MAPKNTDTDPSTPSARRPLSRAPGANKAAASVETEPEGAPPPSGASPARQPEHTDPGVGPPSPVRSLMPQAVGLVVPGPAVAAALGDAVAESAGTPPMPLGSVPPTAAFGSARPGGSSPPPAFGSIPPDGPPPALPMRQDSVELLLDGISGPRPGRARTTPQTGGQAAAAYHAEHDLHTSQAEHDLGRAEEPKNARVERPVTPRAIPIAAAAARKAAQIGTARVDSTVVTGRALARRLVLALVGALVVVAVLFTALRSTKVHTVDARPPEAPVPIARAGEPSAAATAQPSAAATPEPSAAAQPPSSAPVPSPASETAAPAEAAEPGEASSAAAASGVSAAGARPAVRLFVPPRLVHKRHRAGSVPAAASGGDVGEFKTTF